MALVKFRHLPSGRVEVWTQYYLETLKELGYIQQDNNKPFQYNWIHNRMLESAVYGNGMNMIISQVISTEPGATGEWVYGNLDSITMDVFNKFKFIYPNAPLVNVGDFTFAIREVSSTDLDFSYDIFNPVYYHVSAGDVEVDIDYINAEGVRTSIRGAFPYDSLFFTNPKYDNPWSCNLAPFIAQYFRDNWSGVPHCIKRWFLVRILEIDLNFDEPTFMMTDGPFTFINNDNEDVSYMWDNAGQYFKSV